MSIGGHLKSPLLSQVDCIHKSSESGHQSPIGRHPHSPVTVIKLPGPNAFRLSMTALPGRSLCKDGAVMTAAGSGATPQKQGPQCHQQEMWEV